MFFLWLNLILSDRWPLKCPVTCIFIMLLFQFVDCLTQTCSILKHASWLLISMHVLKYTFNTNLVLAHLLEFVRLLNMCWTHFWKIHITLYPSWRSKLEYRRWDSITIPFSWIDAVCLHTTYHGSEWSAFQGVFVNTPNSF